jgi:hypothetical protein
MEHANKYIKKINHTDSVCGATPHRQYITYSQVRTHHITAVNVTPQILNNFKFY